MAHRKLKTPRRKSVTKPTRRYDVSGRTVGSGVATRRTPKPKVTGVTSFQPKRKVGRPSQGKTEVVTSKTGKVYRRTISGAKPKVLKTKPLQTKVTPSTVYVAGGRGPKKVPVDPSEVVVKRGKTAIAGTGTKRGGPSGALGRPGGYGKTVQPESGPVKQATQAEIKSIQKQMDAERNLNRAKAEKTAFDQRFQELKDKISRGRGGGSGAAAAGIPGQVGRWVIDRKTGKRMFKLM